MPSNLAGPVALERVSAHPGVNNMGAMPGTDQPRCLPAAAAAAPPGLARHTLSAEPSSAAGSPALRFSPAHPSLCPSFPPLSSPLLQHPLSPPRSAFARAPCSLCIALGKGMCTVPYGPGRPLSPLRAGWSTCGVSHPSGAVSSLRITMIWLIDNTNSAQRG